MNKFDSFLCDCSIGLAAFVFLCFCLLTQSCGIRVNGEQDHKVEGEVTVNVVVKVDITPCQELEPEAKATCIETLVEVARAAAEGIPQQQQGFGGI